MKEIEEDGFFIDPCDLDEVLGLMRHSTWYRAKLLIFNSTRLPWFCVHQRSWTYHSLHDMVC
jgi:hypothetical protein